MVSLKTRLSAALAVSLVLLLSAQWWLVSRSIESMLEEQLGTRLTHDAESLLAGLSFGADGAPVIDTRRVALVYERPFSGHYYVVRSNGLETTSRSLWDLALAIPDSSAGQQSKTRLPGPAKQRLFVLASGYSKLGRNVTIAVAEDLSDMARSVARFEVAYGLVSAVVLGVLLLVQWIIVRGGLRPLDAIRREMNQLERGATDRIAVDSPSEIAPVVEELNRLLGALANRTRRSRVAMGNLAHALKTQLAVLAQVAARPELHRLPELRRALEEPIEASRRIVEHELRRARLSGAGQPGMRLPLRDEVAVLTATLRQLYAEKSVAITVDAAADAVFEGDREDFLELLGNLLDNACKWCASQVLLTVETAQGLDLVVEDDGPGCSDEQLEELSRRGFRADESKPGSGLGLAIVKDVAESYGGTLSISRSGTLGGLRVHVQLPPKADRPPESS
jgi:signal transduction histidine kinase